MSSKVVLKAVLRILAPVAVFLVLYIKYVVFAPSNPEYLGIVQTGRFTVGQGCGTEDKRMMQYEFEVDGKQYRCNWSPDDNKWMTGPKPIGFLSAPGDRQSFLVIYDPADPGRRSLLRGDCPIGDSVDFCHYVRTFEWLRREGHIKLKASMTQMMVEP